MFLILLAALSNVDRSLLEGGGDRRAASGWRVFRQIVLPAIKPVVIVALTIRGLDLIRLFDIVWALTRGGPGNMTETISVYAYVKGFERFDVSMTAALTFRRHHLAVDRRLRPAAQGGDRTMSRRALAPWFRRRDAWSTIARVSAATAITVLFLFPIYWLFINAFKTPEEVFASPPAWWPATPTLETFRVLFRDGDVEAVLEQAS